ncbi:uncharacterized protein LOC144133932 [Amblyomma americanum]
MRGERDELRNVKRALADAHVSWPGRSTQLQTDALRTLLTSAIRLGWAAILRVDMRDGGPESAAEQTVVLSPSHEFGMLVRKHASQQTSPGARRAYVQLLRDELGSGGPDIHDAFEETEWLNANFLTPLAKTLGEQHQRENLEGTAMFSGRRAVEERWQDALTEYRVHAGRRARLRTEHGNFVRTFLDLWQLKGEDDAHLFISWCTVQIGYVPVCTLRVNLCHVSATPVQVAALFASQRLIASFYDSEKHALVIQGLFCLARAYLLSGFALFAGYSAELFQGDARAHAAALVRAVRNQLRRILSEFPPGNNSAVVVADWNSTEVVFSAVDPSEAAPDHEGGYSGYPYMGDSLVENWRRAAEVEAAALPSRGAAISSAVEAHAFYAVVERDFVLLPYAFAFPLYDEDSTGAMNFAGLGSQVALALGELFLEAYRDNLPQKLRCLRPGSTSIRQTEREALQVLSFNVLFDAYRAAAQPSDKRLLGWERLSRRQLFFVAACYAMCPGDSALLSAPFIAGLGAARSAGKECDAVFRRTGHFARAFECPPEAPMNSGADCRA